MVEHFAATWTVSRFKSRVGDTFKSPCIVSPQRASLWALRMKTVVEENGSSQNSWLGVHLFLWYRSNQKDRIQALYGMGIIDNNEKLQYFSKCEDDDCGRTFVTARDGYGFNKLVSIDNIYNENVLSATGDLTIYLQILVMEDSEINYFFADYRKDAEYLCSSSNRRMANELLLHVSTCTDDNCSSTTLKCWNAKQVISHVATCIDSYKTCTTCMAFSGLLRLHGKICDGEKHCNVKGCSKSNDRGSISSGFAETYFGNLCSYKTNNNNNNNNLMSEGDPVCSLSVV